MSWGVTTVGFAKIEVIPAPADTVKFSACMFLPWSRLDSLEDMLVHDLNEGKRVKNLLPCLCVQKPSAAPTLIH